MKLLIALDRHFERFFETRIWKLLTFSLLGGLIVVFLQLGVYVSEEIKFLQYVNIHALHELRSSLEEAYFYGLVATTIILALILAILIDLRRASTKAHYYDEVQKTILRYSGGDRDARVAVQPSGFDAPSPISLVAESFNTMADSLNKIISELEHNDRFRRELIAYVAHDLGSPLTAIQGFAETIREKLHSGSTEASTLEPFVATILSNSKYLSNLVLSLAEISKFDQVGFQVQREHFSLSTLIQDVTSRFVPEAKEHAITLSADCVDSNSLFLGDLILFERVITNLITNALVYTDDGGAITLSLSASPTHFRFLVSDNGCGIPSSEIKNIFECFYRVEAHRPKRHGGEGLGLALVKKVVEAHEGTVHATSTVGKGTTITIILPTHLDN